MNLEDYRRIQDLIDGDLAPVEREPLLERIEHDRATAREFEEALAIESLLLAAHGREPNLARVAETLRARMPSRRRRFAPGWLAAAAGFAIVVLGSLALAERARTGAGRGVEGGLFVAGSPAVRVPYGEIVRTGSAMGGAIRLRDGSRVALDANSAVIVRTPAPEVGRRIELLEGAGEFTVVAGPLPFTVWTASGQVRVTGTRFTVRLLPDWRPAESAELAPESPTPMEVAVSEGTVRVEFQRNEFAMVAGERRVFAVERPRRPPVTPGLDPTPPTPPAAPSTPEDSGLPASRVDGNVPALDAMPDGSVLVRTFQAFVVASGDTALALRFGNAESSAQTFKLQWAPDAVIWVEKPAPNMPPIAPAPDAAISAARWQRGTWADLTPRARVTVTLSRYGVQSVIVHQNTTE